MIIDRLINKTDLVTEDQVTKIEQQIISISPIVQLEKTSYGKIDTDQILNRELFHHSSIEQSIGDFNNLTFVSPVKEHAHKIQTFSFTISGDFAMQKFSWWLENFLIANAENVLRIKGILSFEGLHHKIALQSVGDNFHISQGNLWNDD